MAVCGTATGVGKTWVAAATVEALRRRRVSVAARKPVQSFDPGDGPTDAEVLGGASGEAPAVVCRRDRWYEVALAPPVAAEMLGRPPFTIVELAAEVRWPAGTAVGLVETVGGPRSPAASDGDSADLARAVGADLAVLVAPAGLGAINAARLSAPALAPLPVVVVLNHYDDGDPVHRSNRAWLSERDGFEVAVSATELADRLETGPAPHHEAAETGPVRGRGSGPPPRPA